MKKRLLIEKVKREILGFTSLLSESNTREMSERIAAQLTLLEAIEEATFISEGQEPILDVPYFLEHAPSEVPASSDQEEAVSEEVIVNPSMVDYVSPDKKTIRGKFKQRLRGGFINGKLSTYVPEKICRYLQIDDGDYLEAVQIGSGKNVPQYNYSVLLKGAGEKDQSRKVAQFMIVRKMKDLDRLTLDIRLEEDDMLMSVVLSVEDCTMLKLQEGDIVDYAYYSNHPEQGRVIWKYNIEDMPKVKANKSPNKSVKKVPVKKDSQTKKRPIFQDLSILMVGGLNKKLQQNVSTEVIDRKGKFLFCSGDEPPKTIESKIKTADIIIVFTQSISHEAMWLVRDSCKELKKVHTFTKNTGGKALVARISEMKKKLLMQTVDE